MYKLTKVCMRASKLHYDIRLVISAVGCSNCARKRCTMPLGIELRSPREFAVDGINENHIGTRAQIWPCGLAISSGSRGVMSDIASEGVSVPDAGVPEVVMSLAAVEHELLGGIRVYKSGACCQETLSGGGSYGSLSMSASKLGAVCCCAENLEN